MIRALAADFKTAALLSMVMTVLAHEHAEKDPASITPNDIATLKTSSNYIVKILEIYENRG
jgi:hypothetical protein